MSAFSIRLKKSLGCKWSGFALLVEYIFLTLSDLNYSDYHSNTRGQFVRHSNGRANNITVLVCCFNGTIIWAWYSDPRCSIISIHYIMFFPLCFAELNCATSMRRLLPQRLQATRRRPSTWPRGRCWATSSLLENLESCKSFKTPFYTGTFLLTVVAIGTYWRLGIQLASKFWIFVCLLNSHIALAIS